MPPPHLDLRKHADALPHQVPSRRALERCAARGTAERTRRSPRQAGREGGVLQQAQKQGDPRLQRQAVAGSTGSRAARAFESTLGVQVHREYNGLLVIAHGSGLRRCPSSVSSLRQFNDPASWAPGPKRGQERRGTGTAQRACMPAAREVGSARRGLPQQPREGHFWWIEVGGSAVGRTACCVDPVLCSCMPLWHKPGGLVGWLQSRATRHASIPVSMVILGLQLDMLSCRAMLGLARALSLAGCT